MRRFLLFLGSCLLVGAVCVGALTLASGATGPAILPPLALIGALASGFALVCFGFGLATGDYSWVDRLWSLAPLLFAWLHAGLGGWHLRPLAAAALVTLWGLRLTRNFARRGGYAGTEDYRWALLRGRITRPLVWQLFHALFICLFQIAVLALITAPLGRMAAGAERGGAPLFLAGLVLALACLVYESIADEQQWRFQQAKAARLSAPAGHFSAPAAPIPSPTDRLSTQVSGGRPADFAEDLERGFRTTGLFALSRHPNYFGELGFWWSLYLASCAGSGLLHGTIAGALALTAIFVGSTRFTEGISAAKYPAYRLYQATTSAILPWFRRRKTPPSRAARSTRSA